MTTRPRRWPPNEPAARRTSHYTPARVARHLVNQSLGRWLWRGPVPNPQTLQDPAELAGRKWRSPADILRVRVLDPACGDGAFLLAARDAIHEYLAARGRGLGHPAPRIEWLRRVACEVLCGVDVDEDALTVARNRLRTIPGDPAPALATAALPLRLGNALVTPAWLDRGGRGAPDARHLHAWDPAGPRGFPTVLAAGGFDVILGNPPYANREDLDPVERRIFADHYVLAVGGQPDLFQLFYELTLGALLRPGGVHAFLVPDAFLARDDHAAVRRHVAGSLVIEHVVKVGAVFTRRAPSGSRRVAVATVGIVGVKRPVRDDGAVEIARWSEERIAALTTLPRKWVCPQDGGPWAVAAPRAWFGARGLRARIEAPGLRLGHLLRPGAEGLTRGEELGKSRLASLDPTEGCAPGCVPILAGSAVRRHVVLGPGHQVSRASLRKGTLVTAVPRLLIVKTGGGLVAASSGEAWPVLQSLYVLRLSEAARSVVSETALSAILCSAVLTAYVWFRWTSGKALHPQLTLGNVRDLPLPARSALAEGRAALEALVSALVPTPRAEGREPGGAAGRGSKAAVTTTERAIDERVADLYGLRLCDWEPLLQTTLAELPASQRSAWIAAPSRRSRPRDRST
ncbi:MAG: hypothetical protein JW751_23790 [Polyangiaceae bacterium]|nr:hypothetical protein [Polyangiaceae bacterium]